MSDDIIRIARQAGSIDSEEVIETVWCAFSALVRADEREACAKVCEDKWVYTASPSEMAEYIRAITKAEEQT